uniref:Uncharacterized protein n=1 Tax=Magnetococcus massalia (strain MO-1) TaxID=451514 RepID=A0A1S7LPJ0_MAGMO|nr:Conserved protein of unknown function [Candidatus Magnetococcus massalia]
MNWQESIESLATLAREGRIEEANEALASIIEESPEVVGQWFILTKILAGQPELWEARIEEALGHFGSAPAHAYRKTVEQIDAAVDALRPAEAAAEVVTETVTAEETPVAEPVAEVEPEVSIEMAAEPLPSESVEPAESQPAEDIAEVVGTYCTMPSPFDSNFCEEHSRLQSLLGKLYVYRHRENIRMKEQAHLETFLGQLESYKQSSVG